jgi:hypothetical protein
MDQAAQRKRGPKRGRILVAMILGVITLSAYQVSSQVLSSSSKDREKALIAKGERLFFQETFNGNGRTCGTCHRAEANFAIDAAFIATLPDNDPLFVAEFNPDLKFNFENPKLMREFGLILENQDGFGDLENKFVMRAVPHVLALRTSVASSQGPHTGYSGDGSPDGTLRTFATGAVIQHFTKTLKRAPGVDFRRPTEAELEAMEAFMLSLGRQQDLTLPLPLKGVVPKRGQELFLDPSVGKCNLCHVNAGATANFGGANLGNINVNTGVETLPDQPQDLTGERVPPDDGLGTPGDGTFNILPLVETADTGPFFHNNAIRTIEGAVGFYDGEAFNNSPAGQLLGGIELDSTQIEAIAAFLRVLNALENIRASIELLEASAERRFPDQGKAKELLERAVHETEDSIRVLTEASLHPEAVSHLQASTRLTREAIHRLFFSHSLAAKAIAEQKKALDLLVEPS